MLSVNQIKMTRYSTLTKTKLNDITRPTEWSCKI